MQLSVYGVGRAVADAELRHTNNGNAICTVNLAFNRSYRHNDEWKQETTFLRAQAWGKRGEKMAELIKKGQDVLITGHLSQENWTTRDDQKRTTFTIRVDDFQLCERMNGGNGNGGGKQEKQEKEEKPPVNETVPPGDSDESTDDIPF
jgi:single-strand DNA-binding protein